MDNKRLKHYRELLISMRHRITGEVEHMIVSIQEEANPTGNVSNVPVHFGDNATTGLDADVRILETEQGMLGDVNAALARIEDGTYGTCTICGTAIAQERLESIPQTATCIQCAGGGKPRVLPR